MKVYISGKIGEEVISDYTREKFEAAEEMLQSMGHEVFNPASEAWQRVLRYDYLEDKKRKNPYLEGDFPDFYTYAILRDNMILATKDAIFMLQDWDISPGAKAEQAFAIATKKKILFASREHAVYHLEEEWKKAKDIMSMRCPRYKFVDYHLHEIWVPIKKEGVQ